LENLRENKLYPIHDPVKTDIFTFGVTIIEAALLREIVQDLYDFEKFQIKTEVLERALNEMSMKYS